MKEREKGEALLRACERRVRVRAQWEGLALVHVCCGWWPRSTTANLIVATCDSGVPDWTGRVKWGAPKNRLLPAVLRTKMCF